MIMIFKNIYPTNLAQTDIDALTHTTPYHVGRYTARNKYTLNKLAKQPFGGFTSSLRVYFWKDLQWYNAL